MLNLKPSGLLDPRTLGFLQENPSLSQNLIAELGDNLNQVVTIIEPILDVQKRCEISAHYVQAVATGRTAFLTTNLPAVGATHVTEVATSWLIGRSHNCAIAIPKQTVSRCHAVIRHDPNEGFCIMDLGSSNGTFVNRSRLTPLNPYTLQDGDLLEFSKFRVEFFVSGWTSSPISVPDTHF
jgi:hypothetical protein